MADAWPNVADAWPNMAPRCSSHTRRRATGGGRGDGRARWEAGRGEAHASMLLAGGGGVPPERLTL
eukprot:2690610-Prymnesium_polylepis.1